MTPTEYAMKVAHLEKMVQAMKRNPPPFVRVELISNTWEDFADLFNDAYAEAFGVDEAKNQIMNDKRLR